MGTTQSRSSRREFFKATGVLAAGAAGTLSATTLTGHAAGPAEKTSASNTRVGFIGVGGRGTYLLRLILQMPEIDVTAVCDINESHLNRAIKAVEDARHTKPAGYSDGPFDYRRLLDRGDVDAVVIATPMPLHAPMAVDALNAGKHAYSEVAAAMTLDECWALVETEEKTGRLYMLAENYCYFEHCMTILEMVRRGVFGEPTWAECGYVHDCRAIKFEGDGTLTWRGEMSRDYIGNLYPTHSLGPVAQWLGINRGDRLVSLASMTTRQASLERYAKTRFGPDHPAAKIKFAVGDCTSTILRTARGVVIDLRYDTSSARPHPSTTYQGLQGTTAAYISDGERIWIEGRSKEKAWEPLANYEDEFRHALWKQFKSEARKTAHGGGDYFVIREFVNAIRNGTPVPIGAVDAATWSSIIPLSAQSIREGGKAVEVPDFTKGKWKRKSA